MHGPDSKYPGNVRTTGGLCTKPSMARFSGAGRLSPQEIQAVISKYMPPPCHFVVVGPVLICVLTRVRYFFYN